jgi:hypothetical protein
MRPSRLAARSPSTSDARSPRSEEATYRAFLAQCQPWSDEIVATGHLSAEEALSVGDPIIIGERQGVLASLFA